jgi:signal peptidase I
MKQTLLFFWEVIKIVILALLIVIPIRYFVFQPFIVKGVSMEPNFHDGDYLIIDEFTYHFRDPQRGEVVVFKYVFKYPQDPSQRFIKRIIGLPNEKITLDNDKIIITNKFGERKVLDESSYLPEHWWEGEMTVTLKDNQYFVLGDNRLHSYDSRKWGVLPREYIVGRVVVRAWPPKAMAFIATPSY